MFHFLLVNIISQFPWWSSAGVQDKICSVSQYQSDVFNKDTGFLACYNLPYSTTTSLSYMGYKLPVSLFFLENNYCGPLLSPLLAFYIYLFRK